MKRLRAKLAAITAAGGRSIADDRAYWFVLIGYGLVVRGVAILSEPFAFIVAGVGSFLLGVLMAGPASPRRNKGAR